LVAREGRLLDSGPASPGSAVEQRSSVSAVKQKASAVVVAGLEARPNCANAAPVSRPMLYSSEDDSRKRRRVPKVFDPLAQSDINLYLLSPQNTRQKNEKPSAIIYSSES
jgi:hypothetical protein